jgi:hypothetical protein
MAKSKYKRDRSREVVCTCGAYHFPHRMFGGKCSGTIASYFWNDQGECSQCNEMPDEPGEACAVADGRESPKHCLMVQGLYPDGQVVVWNPRLE